MLRENMILLMLKYLTRDNELLANCLVSLSYTGQFVVILANTV